MDHLREAYLQIPPITRAYSTICVLTTLSVQLEFVSELQLYFNPTLTFKHFQLWRLITTFCYFGRIGFNFALNIIFIYQYCRMLEENSFRRRSADFLLMFIVGGVMMLMISVVEGTVFLGHALTIMIVYVWSRRNPFVRMSFFGVFTFQAPYLPWVLVAFSFLLGNGIRVDIIGIAVGHVYYFLEDVLPNQINGFKVLKTPKLIKDLIDGPIHDPNYDPLPEAERPGGFNWGQNEG